MIRGHQVSDLTKYISLRVPVMETAMRVALEQ